MDEGHKAVSKLAHETLYGFNPSFVLELAATPKDVAARGEEKPRHANVLVEVTGTELERKGMVKMPLNLDSWRGDDWRATLAASLDRLNVLARDATAYRAESGRFIRPVLLVQVERTGKEQRDGAHIHAEDAKEWLLAAGLDEAEIAVKTADTNAELLEFDPAYAVRMISDLVPNPWVAREIVGKLVNGLRDRGFSDDLLGGLAGLIVAELRAWLRSQQGQKAEAYFREAVACGEI